MISVSSRPDPCARSRTTVEPHLHSATLGRGSKGVNGRFSAAWRGTRKHLGALQAKPGQTVAVSSQPGGAYKVDTGADWYLIGGDAAALPAMATLLEALPASCFAHVFAEVTDGSERINLESPARFSTTWLHHDGVIRQAGRKLEKAVREFSFPAGSGRIWIGCEAGVMRDIRRHLLHERGINRTHAHTQAIGSKAPSITPTTTGARTWNRGTYQRQTP